MQKNFEAIALLLVFGGLILILAAALLIVLLINQRKFKFSKQLKFLHQEHQKNILQTQIEIQEQTFAYIAREIHDHVGQRLTLARLYLNSRHENNEQAGEELINQSSHLIEGAISDLKHLSRTLAADFIRDNGLLQAIKTELEYINKINHLKISLSTEGSTVFMDTDTELVVFRIIQEALQNIMKHAKAANAGVILSYSKTHLKVTITDDGIGFDTTANGHVDNPSHHSGLANMNKRVQLLRGSFIVDAAPGKGTTIQFQLPIQPIQ